jgi:hypothetical protein
MGSFFMPKIKKAITAYREYLNVLLMLIEAIERN